MALKPLKLRELTRKEKDARERAVGKAKMSAGNAVKVRQSKKKKQ